jgi:DMSO/TMAO reductase YedYZ molybdopterin-dependent catalytic subunit
VVVLPKRLTPNDAVSERPTGARRRLAAGALAGLLAAAASLAVGHLVAAGLQPAASPLLAVGSTFIDLTPEWLKSFAITTFGESDKAALLVGIVVVLALAAAGIGLLSLRRLALGVVAVAALGLVGAAAAALRPLGSPVSVVPAIAGAVAGSAVLVALVLRARRLGERPSAPAEASSRRRFLVSAAGAGALALVTGGLGVVLAGRRAAAATSVTIPAPLEPAAALPAGTELGVEGVTSFYTPNDRFYRVDTALEVPIVDPATWRLRIHGMVDREVTLTLDELLQLPLVERDITLTCVSNQVGGNLAGNARWSGVPLVTVLEEAGVKAGADQIVSRSVDGMTIGTPTAVALDGRDAMLAVSMNGAPLPPAHGAPVRMIVPGLFGYVSATKWLVELELTTFDAFDPYWVERGWAAKAPILTMTRIDTPRPLARLASGEIAVAGVAWAQGRGIDAVEVRVDDGPWQRATLAPVPSVDTWRQWLWPWRPEPGRHRLEARATDGTGDIQTGDRAEPFPSGATGWHSVVVTVE